MRSETLPGGRLMDESCGATEEEAVVAPANVNKVELSSSEEEAGRK